MTLKTALPQTLTTARLTLRAPAARDLADIVRHANNVRMFETTATLPYPYREADGIDFIERFSQQPDQLHYVMTGADDRLMGVVGLKLTDPSAPELGYWLGEDFWGHGYVTEAVAALLSAVTATGLVETIVARALASNPASLRVMEKCGFVITEHGHSVVDRHRGKPIVRLAWRADRGKSALPDAIRTARLHLVRPLDRHVPAMAELANNPRVHQWMTRLPHPYAESDGAFFVAKLARGADEHAFAIEAADGQYLGVISVMFYQSGAPELGYWLGEPHWGQGFGSEAAQAVVAAVRETRKFSAIVASARSDNAPSRHVLHKAGFVEVRQDTVDDHTVTRYRQVFET